MPQGFQKGNAVKSPANTPGGLTGAARVSPVKRRRNASLAALLQDEVCGEYISRYLMEVALGKDPRVTMRDVDPRTGRDRRGPKSEAPRGLEQVPTLEQSLHAMTQLLLRRDGSPAQFVQMQQEIRAAVLAGHAEIDRSKVAALPLEERRRLLAAQAMLLSRSPALPAPSSADPAADDAVTVDAVVDSPAG